MKTETKVALRELAAKLLAIVEQEEKPTFEEFIQTCYFNSWNDRFVPYEYQLDLARDLDRYKAVALLATRQMGTTSMLALFALYKALVCHENVLFLNNNFNTTKHVVDLIGQVCDQSAWKLNIKVFNHKMIELHRGRIQFTTPASFKDQMRGKSEAFDTIIVDNAGFVPFKHVEQLMQLFVTHAPKENIVIATSGLTSNKSFFTPFWHVPLFKRVLWSWRQHPKWDQAWYDERVRALGQVAANREYL